MIKSQTPGQPQAPQQAAQPAQNTQMGAAFASAGSSQQNNGGQQRQASGPSFSFRNLGSMMASPMSKAPGSEVLTKMEKAFAAVAEESADPGCEYTFIPLDMNTTTNLSASALIVAVRVKNALDLGVGYHSLIVEAASEAIQPKYESINGQNVEVTRVIGDAYDVTMIKAIAEAVQRKFPQSIIRNADAEYVPREFNLQDQGAVRGLLANAIIASYTEIATKDTNFIDINLRLAAKDSTLVARTTFNNPEHHDAVGLPVRSDIVIDFSAAPPGNTPQGGTNVERTQALAQVRGFPDLVWAPEAPPQNMFATYQQQQQSTRLYAARFVMSGLEAVPHLTIPMQLLALATALTLRDGDAYTQAFQGDQYNSSTYNLHDIGAIGLEAQFTKDAGGISQRIDTKAATFTPMAFAHLFSMLVRPGLIMSLDVPEVGDSTWYNAVFAAAAVGDANANQAIIDAANYLTDGRFSQIFPAGGRVAVDENNRIHLGYYTDNTGVKKDLREIDYLAILNIQGETDPKIVQDWSDTFTRVEFPLTQRLAARKKIIVGLFPNAVFTGFACRVTFEVQFLDALAQACAQAGLEIRAVTPYNDTDSYQRASSAFVGGTLMGQGTSGLFTRGYGQQQPHMGANRNFGGGVSRW